MIRQFEFLILLTLMALPGCAAPSWRWLQGLQGNNSDERYVGTSANAQAVAGAQVGQYRQQAPPD